MKENLGDSVAVENTKMKSMIDKDVEDFKEYCRSELPILKLQEKAFVPSEIKNHEDLRKYWRLREQIMIYEDTISDHKYYPADWYLACMRLAIECLKHAKDFSEEAHNLYYEKYACMEMDFVGEAHCKIGTQYYPRYGDLAVGEEKKMWEEVIELGYQFHQLMPKKVKERLDAIYMS